MGEQEQALEKEALGIVEKHMEAMAIELADVAKKYGDLKIENANPFVKILYGATKEQMVAAIKELITKVDLDKDGQ